MKKLIIPFVASFGLSLGVATGIVIAKTPKSAPVIIAAKAARVKTDSTPTVLKDSVPAAPNDSSAATVAASVQSAGARTVTPPVSAVAAAPTNAPAAAPLVDRTAPGSRPDAKQKIAGPTSAPANTNVALNRVTPPKGAAVPIKPVSDSIVGRRLAQVFGAMQPKDAARVLQQMDDDDVRSILGSLSSKQQAAILGSFPTQRAASILQATLRTASSGGTE